MEDRAIMLMIVGAVLVVAIAGIAITFSASTTGMVSAYQQVRGQGEIVYQKDPAQLITVDEGVCQLARQRAASLDTFIQRQCDYLNPGRQGLKADCMYYSKLKVQLECLSSPVYQTIQPPQMLV
ncbi:MAG: hypothetical protein QXM31_00370 [Candidatus Woesearchaeota archaeon]